VRRGGRTLGQPTKHVRTHTHKLKRVNHFTVVPQSLFPLRFNTDDVASLDAVDANDAVVARVSFAVARLVDGVTSARAAMRVLAACLDAADGGDVEAISIFLPSGSFSGNGGLDAATALGEARVLAGGGLEADGGLVSGGILAAVDRGGT